MTLILLILSAIVIYYIFLYRDTGNNSTYKNSEKKCPNCKNKVEESFNVCPVCKETLKRKCSCCGESVDPSWKYCPYCEISLAESEVR